MSGTQLSATTLFTLANTGANGSAALNAEVASFDAGSGLLFVAGGAGIDAIDPATGAILATLSTTSYGFVNSVAAHDGVVAIAIESVPKTDPGKVIVLDVARSGDSVTLTLRDFGGSDYLTVGAQPDQIGFTPDGTRLLTANEGEPNSYGAAGSVDPVGSVSIIDIATGAVSTADFTAFNGQADALKAAGVRLFGPGASVAQDLEPEYIAVDPNDPTKAYVTLQEANAIGVLDIPSATFTAIIPLGLKDHGVAGNGISASDTDNVFAPGLYDNVSGMYQPDGIAAVDIGGTTYLITANEGDSRTDWPGYNEEARISALNLDPTAFPDLNGNGKADIVDAIGRLTVSIATGDTDNDGDYDQLHVFGGRSFSVWTTDGTQVFDSGNLLDELIATRFPGSYDENRDDNKGVEPETIKIGQIGNDTYIFVALERADGIAAFRMDSATDFTFTGFYTTPGDDAPEVITFIPAEASPTGEAMIVAPNEGSATTTAYALNATFKLQILSYYGESGLLGVDTAPIMGAMIDKFDDEYANTLVLGEGDSYIPGPWLIAGADPSLNGVPGIGSTALGRPDIAIMNAFGTDASALGNHEFDLGSPVFNGAVAGSGAWIGAQFPLITSNLDVSSDSAVRALADASLGGNAANAYAGREVAAIKGKIAPYAISTQGDEKIGIVGLTTWELLTKTSPNGTRPLDDGDPNTSDIQEVAAYLQAAVDALEDQGVNKIIMVDQLDTLARNEALASLVHGIDIMVAGGGHERLGDADDVAHPFNGHDADFAGTFPIVATDAHGDTTLIVTTDTEYTYLGRLVVEFDADGRIIPSSLNPAINGAYASTEAVLQEAYGTTDSAAEIIAGSAIGSQVQAITDAIDAVISAKDGNIFGYTNVYLEGDRVFGRTQQVNLGDITADANLVAAQDALGDGGLVVSLKNGGGIRASIGSVNADGDKLPPAASDVKPAGAISQLDIENALRFDNRLMVFDTTAHGLLNIMNFAAGLSTGPAQQSGGYMQIGGLRVSYDPDNAAGHKVSNISLIDETGAIIARIAENGVVSADAPALISMVTLNFTANGGDGYPIKANGENFRYLLTDGTVSAAVNEALDFTAEATMQTVGASMATVLGEQKAFEDYLQQNHATPATAYDVADTGAAGDTRIQNLNFVADDTVLDGTTLTGRGGADSLAGGIGDDLIRAGAGNDTVLGGIGNDSLAGHAGDDSILGGNGADSITGDGGADTLHGGGGADSLAGGNGADLMDGGADADRLDGGNGADTLLGGDGDDMLVGGALIDSLVGGAGHDTLDGGAAGDVLDGGDGADLLLGGNGADMLRGGADADTLTGGIDNDTLEGGDAGDLLQGESGRDLLDGGAGADTLDGGDGHDTLRGGEGDDLLRGGANLDRLDGGAGNDTLDGGAHADTLSGGAGDDVLTGGASTDLFIFGAGGGSDIITDLTRYDRILIEDGLTVAGQSLDDVGGGAEQDLVLTLSDGGLITLLDIQVLPPGVLTFA
ncbi:choice-of-anchor I family protein [Roseomonas sp. CAU 1739]|uniref:choice-of-anchor I family protein n=1 Tax=Roseomonas sp. CAU 1739 TaxID=3140364 RepID=UPI00325B2CF6